MINNQDDECFTFEECWEIVALSTCKVNIAITFQFLLNKNNSITYTCHRESSHPGANTSISYDGRLHLTGSPIPFLPPGCKHPNHQDHKIKHHQDNQPSNVHGHPLEEHMNMSNLHDSLDISSKEFKEPSLKYHLQGSWYKLNVSMENWKQAILSLNEYHTFMCNSNYKLKIDKKIHLPRTDPLNWKVAIFNLTDNQLLLCR